MNDFSMNRDEQLRSLKRQYNLTDSQAKSVLDRQQPPIRGIQLVQPEVETPEIPLPIAIVFPWSCLVSDDKRFAPALRGEKPVLLMTEAYRDAKLKAQRIAIAAAVGMRPRSGALELRAKVFVPDNNRRDVVNFSKCLHDILTGTILLDDSQIHRSTWERAGCDVDAPRAEILLTAYGR